jgi:outer membrane protein TolC
MILVIQNGLDASKGCGRFLPVVEMCMNEGGWGTGPNSSLQWDNRWDLGLHAYWNLTDLVTARDKLKLAQSRLQQAEIGYRDLQGKLTMGVQEAQSSIQANKQLISEGTDQIKHATKSYDLNNQRLKQRVEGSSTTEVLASIRVLDAANLASLAAIRAYDKAQVRLMVLMGAAGAGAGDGCAK